MACYLTFDGQGYECAGCGREIRHGLVGWTDEIALPPKLEPVCRNCLEGLDKRLRAVQQLVSDTERAMLHGSE